MEKKHSEQPAVTVLTPVYKCVVSQRLMNPRPFPQDPCPLRIRFLHLVPTRGCPRGPGSPPLPRACPEGEAGARSTLQWVEVVTPDRTVVFDRDAC